MFSRWCILTFVIVSLTKAQIPTITSGAYNIPTYENSGLGSYDKLTPMQIRSAKNEAENDREKLSPLNEPNVDDSFKEVLSSSDSSQPTTSAEDFHQAKIRSYDFKQNADQHDYLVTAANPTDGHDQYKNKLGNMMKNIGKEVSGAVKKIEKALWPSHAKSKPKESFNDFQNEDEFKPYQVYVDGGEIKADEKIKSNINSVSGLMKKYMTVMNNKNVADVVTSMQSKFSPLKQTMDDFQKSLSGFSILNKQNAPQVSSHHDISGHYPSSIFKNSQSEEASPLVKLTNSASKSSDDSKTDPSAKDKKIPEKENPMKNIWNKATDLTSKIVDTVNSAKDQVNHYFDGTQASREPELHKTYYPDYLGQQQPIYPSVHPLNPMYQNIYQQANDALANWKSAPDSYPNNAGQNQYNGYSPNHALAISNAAQDLYHSLQNQNNGQFDASKIWNAGNNLHQAITGQNQNNGYSPNGALDISNAAQDLYHGLIQNQDNSQFDASKIWNAGNNLHQAIAGQNQNNGYPPNHALAISNAAQDLYHSLQNQNNGQFDASKIWNAGNNLNQAIRGQNQNNGYPRNDATAISNAAKDLYQTIADYNGYKSYKREVAEEPSSATNDDSVAEQIDSTRNQRQILPPLFLGPPRLPAIPLVAPMPTISRAPLLSFGMEQPRNVVNEAVSLASGILAKDPTKIAQSSVGLGGSIATSSQANSRILRHIDCKHPVLSINLPEKIIKVSQEPSTLQSYNTLGSAGPSCSAANDLSGNINGNGMITQPNYETYEQPTYNNPDITGSAIDASTDPALQENNPHYKIHNSAIELAHGIVDSLNLDKPSGEFAKSNIKMASQIVSMAINPQNAGNLPTVESTDPYAARWKPITDMTSRIVALATHQGNDPSVQSFNPQYYYISPDHGFISPMFGKLWNTGVKLGSDIKAAPAVLDSVGTSKSN